MSEYFLHTWLWGVHLLRHDVVAKHLYIDSLWGSYDENK